MNAKSFQWASRLASAIILPVMFMGTAHADATTAKQNDPARFSRGAKAWANNCATCHNMRSPKELRDDQWRSVVAHMRVRADLTGQEARDILDFLQGSN